jgi:hypothetical protein
MELGFDLLLSRLEACSFVFSSWPLLRDRQCCHAALCRPIETSSDVGMIGMITASERHHRPCRQTQRGTKPKFFNDFSRARACAYAQGGVRSESASNEGARLQPATMGNSLKFATMGNSLNFHRPDFRAEIHFRTLACRSNPDHM